MDLKPVNEVIFRENTGMLDFLFLRKKFEFHKELVFINL